MRILEGETEKPEVVRFLKKVKLKCEHEPHKMARTTIIVHIEDSSSLSRVDKPDTLRFYLF